MNGTSDIKIEDHHNHEKDNIKVMRDFEILGQKIVFGQNFPKIMLHKNVHKSRLQF